MFLVEALNVNWLPAVFGVGRKAVTRLLESELNVAAPPGTTPAVAPRQALQVVPAGQPGMANEPGIGLLENGVPAQLPASCAAEYSVLIEVACGVVARVP